MLRIKLDDTEVSKLRLLARQEVGRVSERIHFVLMLANGMSATETAAIMGYDVESVRTWVKRYREKGLQGLYDLAKSGRPAKELLLNSILEAQINQPPNISGYVQSVWTVALMVLHLVGRFKVAISVSTVRRGLHRIGYTWKRPKLAPARRIDPERATKETRLEAVLADPSPAVHIVAVDECDCHMLAIVRSMWQRIGKVGQKRLPTPGQNQRRGIFGALDLRTGLWHYCLRDYKCSADFIVLLGILLSVYEAGTIYVIADNCKIHCSKALRQWLAVNPRIQMVYLPTYSGHLLNPVEKVWWQLKRYISANRNFHSLAELDAAIRQCLDLFTPDVMLQLCNSPVSRAARLPLLTATKVVNSFGD